MDYGPTKILKQRTGTKHLYLSSCPFSHIQQQNTTNKHLFKSIIELFYLQPQKNI